MSETFGMPGVGGSLGVCALCGNTFLKEILLGDTVRPFNVDGCQQTLFAHKSCLPKADGKIDVLTLPAISPLRKAFDNNNNPI